MKASILIEALCAGLEVKCPDGVTRRLHDDFLEFKDHDGWDLSMMSVAIFVGIAEEMTDEQAIELKAELASKEAAGWRQLKLAL